MAPVDECGTSCRYAEHDQFWVEGSRGGEGWEVYTVLADASRQDEAPADAAVGC